jgi:hypothetical protein
VAGRSKTRTETQPYESLKSTVRSAPSKTPTKYLILITSLSRVPSPQSASASKVIILFRCRKHKPSMSVMSTDCCYSTIFCISLVATLCILPRQDTVPRSNV